MTTSARALARRVPSEGPPLRISSGPAARSAKPRRDDVGGALGDAQRWSNRRRKACGGRRESGDAFFFSVSTLTWAADLFEKFHSFSVVAD